MKPLEWDDSKMNIGIKKIDDQHKELLNIINKLSTSVEYNSQKKDVLNILDELIEYASFHFDTEEKLFQNLNYPNTQEHIEEHEKFTRKFLEIKESFKEKVNIKNQLAIDVTEDIFLYITKWFIEHVIGCDKKYVKMFEENKIS